MTGHLYSARKRCFLRAFIGFTQVLADPRRMDILSSDSAILGVVRAGSDDELQTLLRSASAEAKKYR